jgi:sugar fermentation stimulation protein A
MVHVANTGRMRELLLPQNPMYVAPVTNAGHRKTVHDLTLVEFQGVLASVDSRLPNRLVREAVEAGRLEEFSEYPGVRPEVTFHDSRIDLLLSGPAGSLYLETKSVNLVKDGTALFPDAPTERGRKHLVSLMKAIDDGHGAAVVFVIQRPDAERFSPFRDADPAFADALRRAEEHGVQVIAYRCDVSLTEITISDRISVILD